MSVRLLLSCLVSLCLAASASAATVEQFVTPDGQFNFLAAALNDDGVVVGNYYGTAHRWENGTLTPLPGGVTGYAEQSSATDINATGQISGWVFTGTHSDSRRNYDAAVWDPGASAPRILARIDPTFGTRATAINAVGMVVGWGQRVEGGILVRNPVRWLASGAAENLLPANGIRSDQAMAVNGLGTVLINGDTGRKLWRDGALTDLGCLSTTGGTHSLSEDNRVVGANTAGVPAVWTDGVCTPLQLPDGAGGGTANAINGRGEIAGTVSRSGGTSEGVVWDPDGKAVLVDSLLPEGSGVDVITALDINESGQILAQGRKGDRTQYLLISPDRSGLEVTLDAVRPDGRPATGVVAEEDLLARLTVTNTGSVALKSFTFAGGRPLVIDERGTGRIVQTGEIPFPPGFELSPGASETAWFSITTLGEGIAAAHSKVTARTASGTPVEAARSLKFVIADRQQVTDAIGRYLVLQLVDRFVFKNGRDLYASLLERSGDLRKGIVRALDAKQRRRWFGNAAGRLQISNLDRAIGFLQGVPPELVAARLPNEPIGGFTAKRLNREYDAAFKREVGEGVAQWVKGYAKLKDGVQRAAEETWAAALLNHHYYMGTATAQEREQVEAFYYAFAQGVEGDATNLVKTLQAEIPKWRQDGLYAAQAVQEAERHGGLAGFLQGVGALRKVYAGEQALSKQAYSFADSDPLRFQREVAKLNARYVNAGLPVVLDTLLGAGAVKLAAGGRKLLVGGKGASVIKAGELIEDGSIASSGDEIASGLPTQTAVELDADGGLLANTRGATLVQASDHGNVYSLPNLGGVPEITLDGKARILGEIEREYAAAFGKPAPKLVEVLKTSSPLRKPGSVAKLELTAGKTGKPSMVDAGMPADALGEAVYWKSDTNPRKLPGFDALPPARRQAAIEEFELANQRWKKYADPKPGSKEAKLKSLVGKRGRVPLDDEPKQGLQRFVTAEFEEVTIKEGGATAKLIRVKHYEIEVVKYPAPGAQGPAQVVNRKTVIDNLEKAAPQTADADAVAVGKVTGTDPATGAPIVAPLDRAEREFVMSRYVDRNVKARRTGTIPDVAEHGVTLVMEDASAKAAGFLLPSFGAPFLPEAIGRAHLARIAPFVKPANMTNEQMLETMLELVRAEGGFGQHAVVVTSDSRYLGEVPFERW